MLSSRLIRISGSVRVCTYRPRTRPNNAFKKKASRLELHNYEQLLDLFLTHSDRIRHPDPRAAVSMALMMVVSTVLELVVTHADPAAWKGFPLPKDDQTLKKELVRAFLSYLDVEDASGAAGELEAEQLAAMKRWRGKTSQQV